LDFQSYDKLTLESLYYFAWISLLVTALIYYSAKRAESLGFPQALNFKVIGWLLITIPIGARLVHIFYEEPGYYLASPFRMLEFWKGGFVYYGGLVSAVFGIGFLFFYKKQDRSFFQTADFFTPIFILGTGLGRVACYIQGCCFGRDGHPTQLYMLGWEMILFFVFIKWEKKNDHRPGVYFLSWLVASAIGRFAVEFFRADFRGALLLGLSISQVIAFMIVLVSTAFIVRRLR